MIVEVEVEVKPGQVQVTHVLMCRNSSEDLKKGNQTVKCGILEWSNSTNSTHVQIHTRIHSVFERTSAVQTEQLNCTEMGFHICVCVSNSIRFISLDFLSPTWKTHMHTHSHNTRTVFEIKAVWCGIIESMWKRWHTYTHKVHTPNNLFKTLQTCLLSVWFRMGFLLVKSQISTYFICMLLYLSMYHTSIIMW